MILSVMSMLTLDTSHEFVCASYLCLGQTRVEHEGQTDASTEKITADPPDRLTDSRIDLWSIIPTKLASLV